MTAQAHIHRATSSNLGTFGVLSVGGLPICVTCEDPWQNNEQYRSCIPPGTYTCRKHDGPRYTDVWEVCDVPGRSKVLIHSGNTINDTRGCILPGLAFGKLAGLPAVMSSAHAMDMLRKKLPNEFTLTIHQHP